MKYSYKTRKKQLREHKQKLKHARLRLEKAAPDLLTACEKIHQAIGASNAIDISNICAKYVIPAIAKAKE